MSDNPKINGKLCYTREEKLDPEEIEFDTIIIGSGIGGMTCASALSKFGHKVLILEQHFKPGGFSHMFKRKGYTWDVGVHAIGEAKVNQEFVGNIYRWLSDGDLEWASLEKDGVVEKFIFPEGYTYELSATKEGYMKDLKEKFPEQADKIDKYIGMAD